MDTASEGVLLSDGRCSVRLKCAGQPNELGYPTLIDVRAGPFSGSVKDDAVFFGLFRARLAELYASLSGEAKLGSYEGFELAIRADRSGAVGVKVTVIGEHVPLVKLTFEFGIDQTYLPRVIKQLDAEFPPPYRTRG